MCIYSLAIEYILITHSSLIAAFEEVDNMYDENDEIEQWTK